MKNLPINILITLVLCFQFGCSGGKEINRFSFEMEGILVGQLDKIKTVYRTEKNELLIPLSERNDEGLVAFIGEENSVELSLLLGETLIEEYTLHRSRSYGSLRIPFEPRFEKILDESGIKLKKY